MLPTASYRNSTGGYFNRNPQSPSRSLSSRFRNNPSLSSSNSSSNQHSADFIYQGRNKQQWATLQSKIRQRLATHNRLYLEDEIEMLCRTTPPATAVTLLPPAMYIETAADKENRIRQQKLHDDDFKKRDSKFDEHRDKLAIDYPKATAAHYHYLSRTIITDLDRWTENIIPLTSDVQIQYKAMKSTDGDLPPRKMPKRDAASSPASPSTHTEQTYSSPVQTPSLTTSPRRSYATLPTTQSWNQCHHDRTYPDPFRLDCLPHGTLRLHPGGHR